MCGSVAHLLGGHAKYYACLEIGDLLSSYGLVYGGAGKLLHQEIVDGAR